MALNEAACHRGAGAWDMPLPPRLHALAPTLISANEQPSGQKQKPRSCLEESDQGCALTV